MQEGGEGRTAVTLPSVLHPVDPYAPVSSWLVCWSIAHAPDCVTTSWPWQTHTPDLCDFHTGWWIQKVFWIQFLFGTSSNEEKVTVQGAGPADGHRWC